VLCCRPMQRGCCRAAVRPQAGARAAARDVSRRPALAPPAIADDSGNQPIGKFKKASVEAQNRQPPCAPSGGAAARRETSTERAEKEEEKKKPLN